MAEAFSFHKMYFAATLAMHNEGYDSFFPAGCLTDLSDVWANYGCSTEVIVTSVLSFNSIQSKGNLKDNFV